MCSLPEERASSEALRSNSAPTLGAQELGAEGGGIFVSPSGCIKPVDQIPVTTERLERAPVTLAYFIELEPD